MQVHRDGEGKEKLSGDQGGDSESGKAFKYNDHEIGIAAYDTSMKDQENCPSLDLKEMKVEHPSEFDHKNSGYMTDFNGEKELNSELSNSVRKIHTEQDDSCSGQKRIGSSVCVTREFDDKILEEEVEHGFKNKKKKTVHQDPCAFHTCKNLLPGKTQFKHAEESDINNFICIRKNKTCFRTLCDCIWNSLHVLPRLFCMDGNAAANDGPTSSELTQDINTEHRHMILLQRDIQAQSQNWVSSESHTLGALTKDMGSPASTVVANMPDQPGIAMVHTSGEVTLKSLNQVSGREATSASQSHELVMVISSGENADEKNPSKASEAEEIFSRKQVTIVQSQNQGSSESHTLGALTMDMESVAFSMFANMPDQPGIATVHTSGEVTLKSLNQVSGREATSANQSNELLRVIASGENADEKNPAKTSAAEEIFSRRQVSEKSETIAQSQNWVSSESHTLGALTKDMGSPASTVVANMPDQPGIAMVHTSGEVTLKSLNQVSGREATSASQSHELVMVISSGENADEKNPSKTSEAEEIFSRKQVTIVQSQNQGSSESHTLGALTMDMESVAFSMFANMPDQPGIATVHTSGEVTLKSLNQVSGREATSANQSNELLRVIASGENADEKNPAKTSAAEEIFSRRQVSEKSETIAQSQNWVSSESHTLGALTKDMGSPASTVVANMPDQPGIAMVHTSGEVTLKSLNQVSGREATSASQSHELVMVISSGENADEKNPSKASEAEEIFSRKQVTIVQSQNQGSSESHTLGALTMDMESVAFSMFANMPDQPGIATVHTSGEVTLKSLNQVSGREATSANQSNELLRVIASGENADEKNPAKTSAAEEIFSRRQVSEKSETIAQSQNWVSSESHTLGALTKDMGSPASTVVANMPDQPGIAMAHTSGEVTLKSLNQVSGREATSASQSHELVMVISSGENADEKNPSKASEAEEIFSRKQVTIVQSQNQGSSESHTLGALTKDMESVAFSMFANMPDQPGIATVHTSGEVTLKSLNQVSGREATSANQSNELLRVIASGENADEKNPAKTSAAEEIFSRRQVSEKSETIAQSQNWVSSESRTLGALTKDMGSPASTVVANMPDQPGIASAHTSGEVTLKSLNQVSGREATSASQSHELVMVVSSGENADEKNPSKASEAEEIFSRKQVTIVQSQNQGSSESHTLGALTKDMESVASSMFANMPDQPGIATVHTSGEVTLKSLNQVSGREATSANQSNELLRVIASGENADEKNPAKISAAEEIFSRRQVSEKSETIAQSQNWVSSESHTLGALTKDMGSPASTVVANMPDQPGIASAHTSGEVTLKSLNQVSGREATSASQSHELVMVISSGENADEKNPSKASEAEEIFSRKQVTIVQSQNQGSSESHTLGALTKDMESVAFSMFANMPDQPGIATVHTSGEVTLKSLNQVSGREATSANQSNELLRVIASGENADEKNPAKTSAAEEIFSRRQVSEKSETIAQSQNWVSSESRTLGALTKDMGSPASTVVANMPDQPGIASAHTSGEVTLKSLNQVSGREATSASQSHELVMVVSSGENADEKNPSKASEAEEIFSRKQVTIVQSQNQGSSESHTLGALTKDMESVASSMFANMPDQPGIATVHTSGEVTLKSLNQVSGREATSANQSNELLRVIASGENADEKNPAKISAAEEIFSRRQVSEKSETIAQSQNWVSSESRTLGALTKDMGSPASTVVANMPDQPGIASAHTSGEVTLKSLNQVSGREATSASQSHELVMVVSSGENADEKNPSKASEAEEIFSRKQVTIVQSQNQGSSESHTLGALTKDMESVASSMFANMPDQPGIATVHTSGEVTLKSLNQVSGREATSANQSNELLRVIASGENADEKNPAKISAAEEIFSRRQVSEKSETIAQSQNWVSSESHTLGALTKDMGSPASTVVANMPDQPGIASAHTSGEVTLKSLNQISGREATSASQSHELVMVISSGENADEKNPSKASEAEEIFSRKQVTIVQSQNQGSSESHTLGALTKDMESVAFSMFANMPDQPGIATVHTSGEVTLKSLNQVSGREATSANQSNELLRVIASGENADEKNPAKTSAAEEIFSRRQVSEKSETIAQSQNWVSSESRTLGALTKDMGSPASTVVANMPDQPGIASAHTSGEVTLKSLNQVSGREATSASQSHELVMVVSSGENADEKNPSKASEAEEIFSRKQVTIVQSQNQGSSESHTLGALTKDMESVASSMFANMPDQPGIATVHTSGEVTLKSLNQVSGREATSANQSNELLRVIASGENADEKNPAKISAAEEIFSRRQVSEKSETIELKEHQQTPDIKSQINQDQDELNSEMNWYISKTWDKVSDLGSCKPHSYFNSTNYICCIINISVYVLALEPRQNDVSSLVTETTPSLPPTVYHSIARQVDGQNVLTASQTVDGHPNGRGSSNNSSQEPQRGMDERINDPTNSPAFQCNDTDTRFTDVHLASGRVTEDTSQDSTPIHESDLNITSMELFRASDVSGMTPLAEARSQHSSVDTRCSDEEDGNGFQTDACRHAVTEQAADGNPFHIAAARSTENEQSSEVDGINKPTSLVNSHGKNGDTGSIKLHSIRSTDPRNGSTTEHVPTRTSNQDEGSANPVEMASMNLATGEIRNTKDEASGGGQNENRRESTSVQETDSAQPIYPQYASNYQRMNSFQGWPARLRQRPEEMAKCGFYYAGFNDCVHCFHCGVGLRRWMHEDDPWFEHARWSPSCFYVRRIKGDDFVSSVMSAIAAMEAARKNTTGNDSSNNTKESANGKNKDMITETEETAIEQEPNTNSDIFPDVTRQFQEFYDATICRICIDRKSSVIFLPCGHFGTCTWCSCFLQKCPFCRILIVKKIEIKDC